MARDAEQTPRSVRSETSRSWRIILAVELLAALQLGPSNRRMRRHNDSHFGQTANQDHLNVRHQLFLIRQLSRCPLALPENSPSLFAVGTGLAKGTALEL